MNTDYTRNTSFDRFKTQTARGRRIATGLGIVFLAGALVATTLMVKTLIAGAAMQPSVGVSPPSTNELYYKPTPITIKVTASGLSGMGSTPIAGYQYSLKWDPAVLKWLSGPAVGAGTPTPLPACNGGQQIVTWGTPTYTPTGFVPTFTPTFTNTPLTTTPTNTPTITPTPSWTPTPGGYIRVACASFPGAPTPVPSTVLGVYQFQPQATSPAGSQLFLNPTDVSFVDSNGTPIPGMVSTQGSVSLVACHDVNGDGKVNILDLSIVANHFGTFAPPAPTPTPTPGGPSGTYDPRYDVNLDGKINVLDLSIVASAFGLTC